MQKITSTFILIYFVCFFTGKVIASETVLINELVIEPSQAVELINTSADFIDLSNWYIDDNGGTTYFTIPQNTIIYPNSCVIITGDFNLNKSSSDSIRLFNSTDKPTELSAQLVNSFTYSKSPGEGVSFQRMPDTSDNWIADTASLGLYNGTLQSCIIIPTTTPSPISTPTPTVDLLPTVEPTPTIYITPTMTPEISGIFISEIMVYPDTGTEWLELYNNNDYEVTLTNWYIDDIENTGASPKLFSQSIPAKGFAVYELPLSVFNNDGDNARLLNSEKEVIDSIEYHESIRGKTIGRLNFEKNDVCIQLSSKMTSNNACYEDSPSPTSTPTPTKTPTPLRTVTPSKIPILDLYADNGSQDRTNNLIVQSTSQHQQSNKTPIDTKNTSEVLGKTTSNNLDDKKIIQTSIFASFSYSLLAILSLVLKIKNGLIS